MNYLRIALEHWIAIFLVTLICGGMAVGISLFLPQYYSSQVSLLIVQKQQDATDSYTAQKASEKIGKNLATVIQTFDFMNRAVATGYISPDTLSSSTEARKKQWRQMVTADTVPETGILMITAYGADPGAAENVALGVMTVLTNNSADYYGGNNVAEIKHIDGPITSTRPVKPNLILNGLAALALGAAVTYIFFLIRTEARKTKLQEQAVRYQLPSQPTELLFPEVHYKVLDEYPQRPYVYGAELKDDAPAVAAAPADADETEDDDDDTNADNAVSRQGHLQS